MMKGEMRIHEKTCDFLVEHGMPAAPISGLSRKFKNIENMGFYWLLWAFGVFKSP